MRMEEFSSKLSRNGKLYVGFSGIKRHKNTLIE